MEKVLIFTTDLYSGGVAESTRKLAEVLSQRYKVIVCVYDNLPNRKDIPEGVKINNLNIPLSVGFRQHWLAKFYVKAARLFFLPLAAIKLYFIVVKEKPKVIYSMTYMPNVLSVLVSKLTRTSCIASERQDPNEDFRGKKYFPKLVKFAYSRADYIHVNSPGMIDAVSEFYSLDKDKIFRFDNFFFENEIFKFANEAVDDYDFSYGPVVMTSARLSRQKGHWHLLDIFSFINKAMPSSRLLILGGGELKDYLMDECRKLGIEESVTFLGDVRNPHKYVKRASLFVFPSIWESFGNSLVEAMCLGVPVATTLCPSGPRDIILDGEYGYSLGVLPRFPRRLDKDELTKISQDLIYLIQNGYQAYSKKSRKGYARYDAKNIAEEVFKVFDMAIKGN